MDPPAGSRGETYRIAHCPVKRCPTGLCTRKVDGARVALTVARKRVRPEGVVRAEVRMGSKGKTGGAPKGPTWRTPVVGILLAGAALLSLLALWSYRPRGASGNWAGPVGHSFAGTLLEATGFGGYALALFLLTAACALLLGRPRLSFARAGSWLLFSFCAMGLLDLLVHLRGAGPPGR